MTDLCLAVYVEPKISLLFRNSNHEEKYPLIIKVKAKIDLSANDECAVDERSVFLVIKVKPCRSALVNWYKSQYSSF